MKILNICEKASQIFIGVLIACVVILGIGYLIMHYTTEFSLIAIIVISIFIIYHFLIYVDEIWSNRRPRN